jgi:glycerol uptake operon antiterminator
MVDKTKKERKMYFFSEFPVIAAVKSRDALSLAIESDVDIIFHLAADIFGLAEDVEAVHRANKKLFIHMDLVEGIGKDAYGIEFAKKMNVDGIISTRVNLIRAARDKGLSTVQRFFIVDSRSIDTTVETVKSSKPDMIELMPALLPKVIERVKTCLDIPVIAGGLIETKTEIISAINAGADAISTGKSNLWRD